MHHHFGSPEWVAMTKTRQSQGFQTWQPYTPARAIEDMDRGGVSKSMISITTPGIWFGNRDETIRIARHENEYGAKMVSDFKGRFGLFAVLPLPDVDASLKEIEYAYDTLKAEGIGLLSNWGDKWLGDASFKPVLDELNRRKAIIYTHGAAPGCCGGMFVPGVNETTIEYNTDVSRTIISIISSGTANRTPDIKYILSHGGGTITALTGRFLGSEATAENLAGTPQPNSRLYHLRRFLLRYGGFDESGEHPIVEDAGRHVANRVRYRSPVRQQREHRRGSAEGRAYRRRASCNRSRQCIEDDAEIREIVPFAQPNTMTAEPLLRRY